MAKMGAQDKARAKRLHKHLLWLASNFDGADLGDRIRPEMSEAIRELAAIPG